MQWLQELLTESNSIREYYYSCAANLKIVMTLLGSDPSVTIRFKALDLMQVAKVAKCGGFHKYARRNENRLTQCHCKHDC